MRLTIYIWLALAGLAFSHAVLASEVEDITVQVRGSDTQIVISHDVNVKPKVFTLDNGQPRVVIDLVGAKLGAKLHANKKQKGVGGVASVRYSKRGDGDVRIVADLASGAQYSSFANSNGQLIVAIKGGDIPLRMFKGEPYPRLKPDFTLGSTFVVETTKPAKDTMVINASLSKPVETKAVRSTVSGIPVPIIKPAPRKIAHYRKPVIVIDPGHGGHDPGAIGKTKLKEETVTLKAALELRKQLLATGKYEVVLTRSTDKYIDHDKRIYIARKAGADLFISIHADSTAKDTTRGASVYTLASRAEGRSRRIVNSQNWISGVDLAEQSAPVGDILVDLAQRKTLTKSGEFAEILLPQLKSQTLLVGNSHRKAGYYVLLAPDVPAVLLEMGFLSNAKDEKLLKTAAHRKKLMKSVTQAINIYFTAQSPLQAAR